MHILDYLLLKVSEMEAKTGKNLIELTREIKGCRVVDLPLILCNTRFALGYEFYDAYAKERRVLLHHYIRYNFIHVTALIISLLKRGNCRLLHLPPIVKRVMKYIYHSTGPLGK